MPSQTRSKAPEKGTRGKGRRPTPKAGTDIPLLPVAVAAILVVVAISVAAWGFINHNQNQPSPVAGIKCDQLEQTQVHYHSALQIEYLGTPIHIPTDIGRLSSCFYWLHMHDESPGVIHIESPANQTFTLGDFFDVWAKSKGTAEPLDSTHVSSFTLSKDQTLIVFIDLNDGKGPQRFTGNPRSIVLKAHEVITLEITPPVEDPPPTFTFPNGT